MSILGSLIRFESSGKNVTNVDQSTSSGRARGFFQITDGTWQDYGRRAGIDFSKYPTALSAPYHLQLAVAKLIPLNRWDKITLRRMSAAGETFDVNKTLGENMAAKGETGEPGEKGAPMPAASAVVTGAGQSTGNYASPKEPVPGATQPNFTPTSADPGADTGTDKPSLASVFGDALGGMATGADSNDLGTSGIMGDSSLPGSGDLRTAIGADPSFGQDWMALQGKPPAQLADLFALPTIGEAAKIKPINIAAKSWI